MIYTTGFLIKIILPYCRTELPRNKGGLGKMKIPILSDLTKDISRDYGILLEAGMSLRYVNTQRTIIVSLTIIRSKLTIETLEQGVKYVQS